MRIMEDKETGSINQQRNNQGKKNMKKQEQNDFDVQEIREAVRQLAHRISWQSLRGTMPYDWITYGHPQLWKLCELTRVRLDGKIKKKDKRGYWR